MPIVETQVPARWHTYSHGPPKTIPSVAINAAVQRLVQEAQDYIDKGKCSI